MGYSLLEGDYLESELKTITQSITYLSKLVASPHLDARSLEIYSLFWIAICGINILIIMEEGEYGYLQTVNIVKFFNTYSMLHECLVENWPSLPSWSILIETMNLSARITNVFSKHLSNYFVPSIWLLLPQISSLTHTIHQCGTLPMSEWYPKIHPIPLN